MTARLLRLVLDSELAAFLALFARLGESPRVAILKSLRMRASADGYLTPDGRIKPGVGRIARRRP